MKTFLNFLVIVIVGIVIGRSLYLWTHRQVFEANQYVDPKNNFKITVPFGWNPVDTGNYTAMKLRDFDNDDDGDQIVFSYSNVTKGKESYLNDKSMPKDQKVYDVSFDKYQAVMVECEHATVNAAGSSYLCDTNGDSFLKRLIVFNGNKGEFQMEVLAPRMHEIFEKSDMTDWIDRVHFMK